MRRLFHPSTRKLQSWLEGEQASIERHISTCDYCADRLEPMLDDSNDSIKAALVQLLAVPQQLPDRLRSGIDERLSNQRDMTLIGELFGLPLHTARLMSNEQGE